MLRAIKNVDVHHRTGVLYLYGTGAEIQRRAKEIFVIRPTNNRKVYSK